MFAHACKLGLEGIVSKRIGSRYRSGPSRNWLKSLNPDFQRRAAMTTRHTRTDSRVPSPLDRVRTQRTGVAGCAVARLIEK